MNTIRAYLKNRGTERECEGKRAKTRIGKPEIPKFLSGADEAVVVMIFPEMGEEQVSQV